LGMVFVVARHLQGVEVEDHRSASPGGWLRLPNSG
jgi:hypothetical protein